MKKILMMLVCCVVLSGCGNTKSENRTNVEFQESQTTANESESSQNEIPDDKGTKSEVEFIDDFEKANFEKFNSPASENGLGDTLIYIDGVPIEKIEDSESFCYIIQQSDGNKWFVLISNSSDDICEELLNENIRLFGTYMGYSEVYKMPAMTVFNEVGYIQKTDNDGKYKTIWTFKDFLDSNYKNNKLDLANEKEQNNPNSEIVSQLRELYKEQAKDLSFSEEDSEKYFEIVLKTSKELSKRGENKELEQFVGDELFNPFVLSAGYLCNNYGEDTEYGKVGNMAFDLIGYIVAKDNDNRDKILNEYDTIAASRGMEIITLDDSEIKSKEPSETESQEPIELSTGKYIVGEDIPSGKYDIVGIKGGNVKVCSPGKDYGDILSEIIESGETVYSNVQLEDEQILEIVNGGKVQLQPK